MKYLIIILAFIVMSCTGTHEKTHAHNPDGSHIDSNSEIPVISKTIWTKDSELFVEFPALIVNKTSRFAAHFTMLKNHKPVSEGTVTVSLIKDNKGIRNNVTTPSSPGIFSPVLQPKEAGIYQLIFELSSSIYTDKIVIEDINVFSSANEAIERLKTQDEEQGNISFLKEQAWKIDFKTEPVTEKVIFDVINTAGVWKHAVQSAKLLAATSNGIINFTDINLTEGTNVKKGQLLLNISSKELAYKNLNTEIANAKVNYEHAKMEYERKKELFKSKIVPKSEFEKVERNYFMLRKTYQSLSNSFSVNGKQIKAPFNGYIKSIHASNGDYVKQGDELIVIGTHQSKVLEMQINPSYKLTKNNVQNIWFKSIDGNWLNLHELEGSILSIGKDISYKKPFISVFASVNQSIDMPEGSLTEVQILKGNALKNKVIPSTALLENYGNFSVIVQVSGENFERRPVTIGRQNGNYVEIIKGLNVGEVVVITGAYQVKMASMSGSTPAHGHEH